MNLREAKYVVSIYKHKNITKAAAKLFISQPSLSRYLQNIESNLGFPLFFRYNNEYIPTSNGKQYIKYATRLLDTQQDWQRQYSELRNENSGTLTIAIPLMRSSCMIPSVFIKFHQKYPNVKLNIKEESYTISPQLLVNDNIDFAIYNPTETLSTLEYIPLRKEPFLLIAAKDTSLKQYSQVSKQSDYPLLPLEYCENQKFILHSPKQNSGKKALSLLKEKNINPNILLQTHSTEVAISLAAAGLGLAFAPESYVLKMKKSLNFSCFSIGNPLETVQLMAVYQKGKYLPSYAKYCIDLLKS